MNRGEVLSGAAFTAVLRSAIAFSDVLVLIGWAALGYVERSLIAELGADAREGFYSGDLHGRTLIVGQRLDLLHHTRILIFRALAICGLTVVLIMLTIGYYLSRQSLLRLREIELTLDKASAGDIAARIPEGDGKTQIDRVARQMNVHLDRLSRMIATTRNTAAAVAHDRKSPLGRAYLALGRALDHVDTGRDPHDPLLDAQT